MPMSLCFFQYVIDIYNVCIEDPEEVHFDGCGGVNSIFYSCWKNCYSNDMCQCFVYEIEGSMKRIREIRIMFIKSMKY